MKASDREMLAFLSKYGQAQYAVILNKCDCVNPVSYTHLTLPTKA